MLFEIRASTSVFRACIIHKSRFPGLPAINHLMRGFSVHLIFLFLLAWKIHPEMSQNASIGTNITPNALQENLIHSVEPFLLTT